jgi:sensor histidine kinase YesM
MDSEHHHVGIDNAKNRLASMCDGTFDLKSKPGTGTTVTITIPKKEDNE